MLKVRLSTAILSMLAVVLVFIPMPRATAQGAGQGQPAPATPAPLAPQPIPTLSPQELTAYWARPLAELCTTASLSVRDYEAIQLLGLSNKCESQRSYHGIWGNSVYGYQHPSATACNAGTGIRTGVTAFATGKSIGTANFLSVLGTLLTVFFAGCNNAVVQSPAQTVAQAVGATSQLAGPSALVLSTSELTLNVGQTSSQINVSENGYGSYFMLSPDSGVASVSVGFGKPAKAGDPFGFTVTAGSVPGKGTITVGDTSGNKAQLTVTVVAPSSGHS